MHEDDAKEFGFWIYLMTDLVIFAVLFAAYAVLYKDGTFGGPTAKELFYMPVAFAETLILLTSSFTCALATYSLYKGQKNWVVIWLGLTFILGVSFLYFELSEFLEFTHDGANPRRSGFLSAFFALVGTHGFHISLGLLWMIITMFTIGIRGLKHSDTSRVLRLAYFWHFLDVVWIFIFTVVYAMGHLS